MPKCFTEGLLPVASLNGVVGLTSSFIRYFIGRTGKYNMLYTLMQNEYMHASETLAFTIRECEIVRNILHVTSTFPSIY